MALCKCNVTSSFSQNRPRAHSSHLTITHNTLLSVSAANNKSHGAANNRRRQRGLPLQQLLPWAAGRGRALSLPSTPADQHAGCGALLLRRHQHSALVALGRELRRHGRRLLDDLLDGADHVEGRLVRARAGLRMGPSASASGLTLTLGTNPTQAHLGQVVVLRVRVRVRVRGAPRAGGRT